VAAVHTLQQLDAALPEAIVVAREIRQCGQRIVYEVEVEGEKRVLKLMDPRMRNRAEREVALANRFDHPNLARILDDQLRDLTIGNVGWVYFTEEFIAGTSLDERDGQLDACEALALAADLVEAVKYLWERNVVHRDIKPANIMETPAGSFVLLDVGIGRHQDLTTITNMAADHGPGTTGYLAPEQLQPLKGRELDYRADLFAIGIVLFEQLTGRVPFDPSAGSYRTRLTTGIITGLDDVPEAMREILRRLLAARPHGRFRLDKVTPAINDLQTRLQCS